MDPERRFLVRGLWNGASAIFLAFNSTMLLLTGIYLGWGPPHDAPAHLITLVLLVGGCILFLVFAAADFRKGLSRRPPREN